MKIYFFTEVIVGILILLLIILAVMITLLFIEALRVRLLLDTEKTAMNMTLLWFYPLIKVIVTMENIKPVLKFYCFNKYLFSKTIEKKKPQHNGTELFKIINPKDISIYTNYGFSNPATTGITCGAINAASQFINIESFKHNPDFSCDNDYVYFDASANVNLGSALINLLKQKKS